jgi:hypothetical protein
MIGLSLESNFKPALSCNCFDNPYGKIQAIEHRSLFDVELEVSQRF